MKLQFKNKTEIKMDENLQDQKPEKTETQIAAQINRIGKKLTERASKAGLPQKPGLYEPGWPGREGLSYTPTPGMNLLESKHKTDEGEVRGSVDVGPDDFTVVYKTTEPKEGEHNTLMIEADSADSPHLQGSVRNKQLTTEQTKHAAANVLSDLRGELASHEISEKARKQETQESLDEILKA